MPSEPPPHLPRSVSPAGHPGGRVPHPFARLLGVGSTYETRQRAAFVYVVGEMKPSGQDSLLAKREAITPEEQQESRKRQNEALREWQSQPLAQHQEAEATVD
jgi:hypothetical protein